MPRMAEFYIGIDLGGTNLRTALFKANSKTLEPVSFLKDNLRSTRPDDVIDFIEETVKTVAGERGISGIGLGVAGMISAGDQIVRRAPNLDWTDFPLGKAVSSRLGCTTEVINDVNAIAWGEYVFGYEKKYPGMLCVFMGTGIGGGLILDGHLVEGSHGMAAEIGHVKAVASPDARKCGCGKSGCIEAYLGGKNFGSWIGEVIDSWDGEATKLVNDPAFPLHAGHVDEAAAAGDVFALSLWNELAPALGMVLANAVTLTDCGVLLMGGTVWDNCPVLRRIVTQSYNDFVNTPSRAIILDSRLGDKAGLYGAAHRAFMKNMSSEID